MHWIYDSWQPIKFLWISFNISEPIGKMIFPQLSLLQLRRHITFICISKWLPPYHKFLHFKCKYLENQRWYWKTVNGVLSYFIRSYIWDQHAFWVNFPFKILHKCDETPLTVTRIAVSLTLKWEVALIAWTCWEFEILPIGHSGNKILTSFWKSQTRLELQ